MVRKRPRSLKVPTAADSLRDPRVLKAEGLRDTPLCVRKVHAIRLKIQDETGGMTAAKRDGYYRESRARLDAECRRLGFTVSWSCRG